MLHPHHVNVSKEILDFYVNDTVPRVTSMHGDKSDDGNYGSAAMCDIDALGSIARRIYFGMFVSEAKFRADPAAFIPHIQSRNAEALAALITKPAVEKVLLARVAQKAEVYGQDLNQTSPDPSSMQRKIDAGDIVRLYEDFIIPLTKKVEVDYLLERYVDQAIRLLIQQSGWTERSGGGHVGPPFFIEWSGTTDRSTRHWC